MWRDSAAEMVPIFPTPDSFPNHFKLLFEICVISNIVFDFYHYHPPPIRHLSTVSRSKCPLSIANHPQALQISRLQALLPLPRLNLVAEEPTFSKHAASVEQSKLLLSLLTVWQAVMSLSLPCVSGRSAATEGAPSVPLVKAQIDNPRSVSVPGTRDDRFLRTLD